MDQYTHLNLRKALKFVSKIINKMIPEVDLSDFYDFQHNYAKIIVDTAKPS